MTRLAALLAAVATTVFAGVAITELQYAGSHPHAYGPAMVIAWAAGAGALMSFAGVLLGISLERRGDPGRNT